MQGDARKRIAAIERKQKAIREELDRLDQAFLFERSNRHVRSPPKQSARGTHACAGPRGPAWAGQLHRLRAIKNERRSSAGAWIGCPDRRADARTGLWMPKFLSQLTKSEQARRAELHEPRGDSRVLLGARDPVPDRGRVLERDGEGDEGHRSQTDRAGSSPPLSQDGPGRSAHLHPGTDRPGGETAGAARTSRPPLLSLVCEGIRGSPAVAARADRRPVPG